MYKESDKLSYPGLALDSHIFHWDFHIILHIPRQRLYNRLTLLAPAHIELPQYPTIPAIILRPLLYRLLTVLKPNPSPVHSLENPTPLACASNPDDNPPHGVKM